MGYLDHKKTRRLIKKTAQRMEIIMSENQDKLDALTAAVNNGVQELRDEINRLASLPPEQVDFTQLQAIADALAGDNIPAAPADPAA